MMTMVTNEMMLIIVLVMIEKALDYQLTLQKMDTILIQSTMLQIKSFTQRLNIHIKPSRTKLQRELIFWIGGVTN